jgi:hypothetical protein
VKWDHLNRFLVHRTEVMTDLFAPSSVANVFRFPDFAQFEDVLRRGLPQHLLRVQRAARQIEYKKSPDKTDDSFHSFLYCFLVSMLHHPRPDVMNPNARTTGVKET